MVNIKTPNNTEPDPLICPLCKTANACVNLGCADNDKTCWCNDATISFPKELLEKIPAENRGKACICKACAIAYQTNKDSNFYKA